MDKFALLGYPISQSVSPQIHKAGFESLGIDATYEILETMPENLIERINFLKNNGYKGVNITIPLKVKMAIFVDEIDKSADVTGAINTVKIGSDGSFTGYNTDVAGFLSAIPTPELLSNKEITILGTGGAARAVAVACISQGVKKINFYTRNIPNSLDFVQFFRNLSPNTEFTLNQYETMHDLSATYMLINATPVGMKGHSANESPLPEHILSTMTPNSIVYDIIYNPMETILVKSAKKLGLKTVSGLDMLTRQAVEAQKIWFNRTPDYDKMRLAGERALSDYQIDFLK